MDENLQNESPEEFELEEPLGFFDKMIGVFTAPASTFAEIAKQPPKVADWLIPLLISIVFAAAAQILMQSDENIARQMKEMQMEAIHESIAEKVESGELTAAEAEERMNMIESRMQSQGGLQAIGSIFGAVVGGFAAFFLIVTIYFLIAKFVFKDEGTYGSAMSAYGLAYYVIILQTIVYVAAALASGQMIFGTSLTAFAGIDIGTFEGTMATLVDPFKIWMYIVAGIGFAKMFKAQSSQKYIFAFIGLWIVFKVIVYFITAGSIALRFLRYM